MNFVTKKFSRMSTRFRTRRSTISGSSIEGRTSFSNSISSISKSCRLKKPTFKRPTFKRRKSVQRVPSIRDAFDEMCRSHILDYIIVSLVGHFITFSRKNDFWKYTQFALMALFRAKVMRIGDAYIDNTSSKIAYGAH